MRTAVRSSPTTDATARTASSSRRAIFYRAAVMIRALVAAILKELVDQVAVRGMQLDATEAGCLSARSGAAEVGDDVGDLVFLDRSMR